MPSNLSVGPYKTDSLGGGIKFGYPVSEQVSVDFGAAIEAVDLEIFSQQPAFATSVSSTLSATSTPTCRAPSAWRATRATA